MVYLRQPQWALQSSLFKKAKETKRTSLYRYQPEKRGHLGGLDSGLVRWQLERNPTAPRLAPHLEPLTTHCLLYCSLNCSQPLLTKYQPHLSVGQSAEDVTDVSSSANDVGNFPGTIWKATQECSLPTSPALNSRHLVHSGPRPSTCFHPYLEVSLLSLLVNPIFWNNLLIYLISHSQYQHLPIHTFMGRPSWL